MRLLRLRETPVEGLPHGYSVARRLPVKLINLLGPSLERIFLRPCCRRIAIDRPIFVIGAFRSGTTLLEQILAAHPQTGYFWFGTHICPRAPVIAHWATRVSQKIGHLDRASKPFLHNPRLEFTLFSPCECEQLWSRIGQSAWDNDRADLTLGADFSAPRFERDLFDLIRRHLFLHHAGRFVHKNPVNSLRVGYLHKLFPDARFIHIVRRPIDAILSHRRTAARLQQTFAADPLLQQLFEEQIRLDVLSLRIPTRTWTQTLALDREHPLLGIANQWKDLQLAIVECVERTPGLAAQVLRLCYADLVSRPNEILPRIWRFVDLDDAHAAAISRAYTPRLSPPPAPALSDEERALLPRIRQIVAPAVEHKLMPPCAY